LVTAACVAAALISACGQTARKHVKHSFSALARAAPSRLNVAQTKTITKTTIATSSTAGDAPAGGTSTTTTPATQLQHALKRALTGAGRQSGLVVADLSDGQTLYSVGANVARPPASVEKLYTTVAALNLLGPSTRLQTTVLGTGRLAHGGVWHGNLYLRGGGDPTFGDGSWNKAYEDGYGPTAIQLAQQLHRDGIRRVTGHIFADASLFDSDLGGPATNDLPDTPDYGGEMSALVYDHGMSANRMPPAVFATHELALTMRAEGISVGAASRTADTPTGAAQLAAVQSPTISELIRLMDVPSDDLIADMLAKQMGARLLGQGTLLGGATEIQQEIGSAYGLHPTIFDGSGLDRDDRTTPAEVVTLLRKLWNTPPGNLLYAALPVVGKQGTSAIPRGAHRCRWQLRGEDGHARRRHQPGGLLSRTQRKIAGVRIDDRRAGQLPGGPDVEPCCGGHRAVLKRVPRASRSREAAANLRLVVRPLGPCCLGVSPLADRHRT
jgi:D-alanyl-D-alanine carboxypeptidase/D-alanyl-D-alanine-endopeptidase (penicillin-binding protein 4)